MEQLTGKVKEKQQHETGFQVLEQELCRSWRVPGHLKKLKVLPEVAPVVFSLFIAVSCLDSIFLIEAQCPLPSYTHTHTHTHTGSGRFCSGKYRRTGLDLVHISLVSVQHNAARKKEKKKKAQWETFLSLSALMDLLPSLFAHTCGTVTQGILFKYTNREETKMTSMTLMRSIFVSWYCLRDVQTREKVLTDTGILMSNNLYRCMFLLTFCFQKG